MRSITIYFNKTNLSKDIKIESSIEFSFYKDTLDKFSISLSIVVIINSSRVIESKGDNLELLPGLDCVQDRPRTLDFGPSIPSTNKYIHCCTTDPNNNCLFNHHRLLQQG